MSLRGQISFGQLFDLLRPALYAFAVVCSTWVLADTRRRRLRRHACAGWTLATLVLPLTTLPLYLAARLWRRPPARACATEPEPPGSTSEPAAPPAACDTGAAAAMNLSNVDGSEPTGAATTDRTAADDEPTTLKARLRALWLRHAPVLVYLSVLTTLGALYFVHDYRSLDAHLARASNAKLNARHERAAAEYRAALRLRSDPHTRKLLGLELAALHQWPEALVELRAAEQTGEPDAALPFHLAAVLDALDRKAEAQTEYQRFLAGELCTSPHPDARCQAARRYLGP